MEEYFETFCKLVEWFGGALENMWNMDETGFRIGCSKAQWVITNDASKALVTEYITSAELINGVRRTILSFLILQDLSNETFLSTSDFGYSNTSLAMDRLRHFDKNSAKEQVGFYFDFIIDYYSSHLTYQFWSYAKEHKIIIFCLLFHSTYFT